MPIGPYLKRNHYNMSNHKAKYRRQNRTIWYGQTNITEFYNISRQIEEEEEVDLADHGEK